MKLIKSLFLLVVSIVVFTSCAQVGQLTGGEIDRTPPRLDSLTSSHTEQLNFIKQPIVFYFDEWIQIKDPLKNIVVSPPIEKPFQFKIKDKSTIFSFHEDEILKENTTYSIFFGNAVVDYTVGNAVKDLSFVFSTGNQIDSLSIKGKLVDQEGNPMKEAVVLLYDENQDSVILNSQPYYLAKASDSGDFMIKNMKKGNFKVVALLDEVKNYQFDKGEKIGFLDSLLNIDTLISNIEIGLFENFEEQSLLESDKVSPGNYKLVFENGIEDLDIKNNQGIDFEYMKNEKEVQLFFRSQDSLCFYIYEGEKQIDSLITRPTEKINEEIFKIKSIEQNLDSLTFFEIDTKIPFTSFDTNKFSLITPNDSIIEFTLEKMDNHHISLICAYKDSMQLTIDTGAVINYFDVFNDKFEKNIFPLNKSDLTNIQLIISDFDTTSNYVFQLMNKNKLVKEQVWNHEKGTKVNFNNILPEVLELKIILDNNKNGKFDKGNYWKNIYPEQVKSVKFEKMRANWEVEKEISLKF